jgi:hypothetical protein
LEEDDNLCPIAAHAELDVVILIVGAGEPPSTTEALIDLAEVAPR